MPASHLYLVDGSSYIFRAYHRLPPLTNRHGLNVGAVYGYTTMLWKLAESLHKADGPTHLAVIFDAAGKTHRDDMYGEYKANRPPPPPDLVPQFPLIRDATRAFSLPCIEEEGLEADDIIACYSMAALAAGWKVTIVSSDKDLMQLIDDGRLDMLDTMNDRRMDRAYVEEKFGVGPEKLGDVLALMGDSVDNVPGVPGIGPKTAAQLIQQYGDLDTLLSRVDEISKPKLKQNLTEHAEAARLSRELVRLVCDSPLPQPLGELEMRGIPDGPLRAFLEDQGFRSLLARLNGQSQVRAPSTDPARTPVQREVRPEPKIDRSAYETVTTEEALDRWITEAAKLGRFALDTETDSRDPVTAKLVGISMATECNRACYIPLEHGGDDLLSERPEQLAAELVLTKLKPLLEDPAVLKIGHNLKFDWVVFDRRRIQVAPFDDTLVMSFDLNAGGLSSHSLDDLAKEHLDHQCLTFKEVCGSGAKQLCFDKIGLDRATEYAAEDADVTLRLWMRFKTRLAHERVTRVYDLVDRPLVPVVARMEREGVKVDRQELSKLSAEFNEQIVALEERICAEAGTRFTIGSPKQLGEILFDKLQLKGGRKGKSGVWSTDVTELERLAKDTPIARLVLDWRQLTKLKNTYTDALQQQINPETGRVHTCYSLSGAQTGRLSSTDPNLQNIPIRTEIGRRIRDAFVAEPGYVMLAADYSQIELRLAAHMADVPQLKAAFSEGADIHNMTAQELFGEVTRDTRASAKTINFAILYGISRWGLAGRLGITAEEAQDMIDRYFNRFPGIRDYIHATLTTVRETGFTTTLFGRKTHFPGIKSKVQHERQGAERAAVNAPIQGTSADIIKRAMARMCPALEREGLGTTRMLLQVHDELVFEVPEADVEHASAVIKGVMDGAAEPAVKLSVPLGVEIGTGANWGAAH
jgi:DNA polymerase-1